MKPLLLFVRFFCIAFALHMCLNFWALYKVFHPSVCSSGHKKCLKNYLAQTPQPPMKLLVYSSTSQSPNGSDLYLVWELNDFKPNENVTKDVTIEIPPEVHNNGTMFVHVFLISGEGGEWRTNPFDADWEVHQTGILTTCLIDQAAILQIIRDIQVPAKQRLAAAEQLTCHWQSHFAFNLMVSDVNLDSRAIPRKLGDITRPYKDQYLPMLQTDEISYRTKDLLPLNDTCKEMPLTITYAPVSFGRFHLWTYLKEWIKQLTLDGMADEKVDELKDSYMGNLRNYFLQWIFAFFHILFHLLSIESDIRFWQKRSTMGGLSSQSVVSQLVGVVVVFLHSLEDGSTNFLYLTLISTVIFVEIWKALKVFRARVCWTEWRLVFDNTGFGNRELETEAHDAQAMRWLSCVLYPLWVAMIIYTLIYNFDKSWYTLCIQSLYNGFTAFGWLYLLPQVYINYKFKSVADLPWTAMMYGAGCSFIRIICRFFIMMPMDSGLLIYLYDVIFVIFVYQRWLYGA